MIAVCMPAFNLLDYTRVALEAVVRHSWPWPIKLFLLDNGSSGRGTHEYMKSVRPDSWVLRVEQNQWVYGGWNILLEAALKESPEAICLLSNDVQVGPGWLSPVMREIAAGGLRYFLPNGNFKIHGGFDRDVLEYLRDFDKIHPQRTVPGRAGWAIFFTPEAVRQFLPLPTSLKLWYGDDYIHWKLRNAGYRCETILDSCALHFGSKTLEAMNQAEKCRIIAQDKAEYERLTGEKM